MLGFVGIFDAGFGANCLFRTVSSIVVSFSCSEFVNIARYTPRYVLLGSVDDSNQIIGGFPEPRFRFVVSASSPSLLFEDICACFFSNADSVVSLRASPSSSSSESESEPDRLSSRSASISRNS